MSFPTHELIPAAILFDNPGITRERFGELLDNISENINASGFGYVNGKPRIDLLRGYSWDLGELNRTGGLSSGQYHTGIYGVAEILGLPHSDRFVEIEKESIKRSDVYFVEEEDGQEHFFYGHKWFSVSATPGEKDKLFRFNVSTRLEYGLSKREQISRYEIDQDLEKGKIFLISDIGDYRFIERIVKDLGKNKRGKRIQAIVTREIMINNKEEEFSSLEELTRAYPHYSPDIRSDWSLEGGQLALGMSHEFQGFKWKKKGDLYFLDEEKTFMEIPIPPILGYEVGTHRDWGTFTDLIITAEAIRYNAWKVLTDKGGLLYRGDFLKAFPKARNRCMDAILDAHFLLPPLQNGKIDFLEFWRKSRVLRNMQNHQNLF